MSVLDNSVDITGDSGVLKRLIRRGNASKGYPLPNDRVDIAWKIYTFNDQFVKVLAHDSRKSLSLESDGVILDENRVDNEKLFQFRIAGDSATSQREVIQGWDIGVRNMFEGEISSFTLSSKYAFGEKGAPPIGIPPNSTHAIECEIELVKIYPSLGRKFKSVGYNESIKDELMEKIQSGESVISKEVMQNKKINETKSADEVKFFDPAIHKIDPNINVKGENNGMIVSEKRCISKHVWEETLTTMDIDIPLIVSSQTIVQKEDLTVTISATAIKVSVWDQTILEGPLQGKVIPSMCMWALLPASESLTEDGFRAAQRIQISLEKSHEHRDIWASALNREYLRSLT